MNSFTRPKHQQQKLQIVDCFNVGDFGTCGSDQRTYTMNGANTNNNHVDGASYDALGNLLANPVPGGASYLYDAESRLIQVLNSGVTTKYLYDAEGRRVAKLSGTTVTNEYLFDTDGSQQIELNGSGTVLHTNLYAGGKLIATYQGTDTYFHFTDWLGTRRYEANSAGAQAETCTNLPFGDSQSCTGTPDATEHHFTGKEHDTESGLDYFGARYYANVLGRFNSPDPAIMMSSKLADPQQWNMYPYVRDNPLRLVDQNGKWPTDIHERIIDKAFPNLSAQQKQILKDSSAHVDRLADQTPSHAHEHAQAQPGESPSAAKKEIQTKIDGGIAVAKQIQGTTPSNSGDIKPDALQQFGYALHTLEDQQSPAHTDSSGNPTTWSISLNPFTAFLVTEDHLATENTIDAAQMQNAVDAAQNTFRGAFGQDALNQATGQDPNQKQDEGITFIIESK